ncbi:MAG: hypothetical protein LBC19_02770, partial [Tannerella sp.]|nr:hypothetical protein [Tannerella sp.]
MSFRKLMTAALSIIFAQALTAQNYKNWNTYLAYHEATGIAESNERIYVLANGSLYSYGKEDNEIRTYSKQNGLSDTDIRLIRFNPEYQTLIIMYGNGNIDLYDKDGFKNLPALKNASNIQSKGVNSIYFYNEYAYISADFGIMVINLNKKEVADTYKTGYTKAVCILHDTVYASIDNGLMKAHIKDNLLDLNNWKEKKLNTTAFDEKNITNMCLFQDKIFFCVSNNGVYYETSTGEVKVLTGQIYIKNITVQSDQLLTYTGDDLSIYDDTERFSYINIGSINDVVSLKNDGKYWIATGNNGLTGIEKGSDGRFAKIVSGITINSPKRNYNAFMTVFDDKKLLVTGGDRMLDRFFRPGTLMIYENEEWYNFDESAANREILNLIGYNAQDYMGVAVDPDDENHYFVATYGEGIIELKDNALVKLHNADNSTLKSAISYVEDGVIKHNPTYVRIGSVCFDKDKNLWATNCLTRNAVNVLKANGEW